MARALLDDRAIIALSGTEARPFLQGLITNDIGVLSPSRSLYAALLTAQGKVLFDFLIFEREGTLLVDCLKKSREALTKRLSMYRLRAKVDIEPRDDLEVVADWDGAAEGLLPDPRLVQLGSRSVSARGAGTPAGSEAYRDRRLQLGVPEAGDFGSDKMFALDADLEELNAISFDKGCYVGQELTARMKHRGTARKRLVPIESRNGVLSADGNLTAGGRNVGEITSCYETRGFALIRLDRLAEAGDDRIEVDGIEIVIHRPPWLSLEPSER